MLELRFGVRLPPPQFCPLSIAELVKQCFHEDPHQRPSFERLRTLMTQVCSSLNESSKVLNNHNSCSSIEEGIIYEDLKMKQRYFSLKNKNKNFKELNHLTSSIDMSNDTNCVFSSSRSDSKTSVNFSPKGDTDFSLYESNDQTKEGISSKQIKLPDLRQKYDQLSKRLLRHRHENRENYYSTYPGKNIAKSYRSLSTVSSSKSSNQLYTFSPNLQNCKRSKCIET